MAERGQGSVGRVTQPPVICSKEGLQTSIAVLTEIESRSADGEIDAYDLVCIVRKAKEAIKADRLTTVACEQADGQIELAQHFTRAITDVRHTETKLERNGFRVVGKRASRTEPRPAA